MWTCTLLQHQNSGNVGELMVLFVKKALTSGCRWCNDLGSLQDHPGSSEPSISDWQKTKQQRYSWEGQVCTLLQVRHESGSDSRSGFYGGSGWCLSSSTDSRLEPPIWNPQWRKTGPVVYHMMCHMMQEEDLQLRKLAGVPGRRDVGWDWRLNDPPLNYYIKPLTTKQLLIICEWLLRGWETKPFLLSVSAHMLFSPQRTHQRSVTWLSSDEQLNLILLLMKTAIPDAEIHPQEVEKFEQKRVTSWKSCGSCNLFTCNTNTWPLQSHH